MSLETTGLGLSEAATVDDGQEATLVRGKGDSYLPAIQA